MERTAVFAGSFCPFTKGHEDIVQQALPLFDKIFIAIGHNINKKDTFSLEQRMQWIQELYVDCPKVEVVAYTGLTADFCRKANARYLIRGVRNGQDFANEQTMAEINRKLNPDVETVLFLASQQWLIVSSSLVRELWSLGADYSPFLSYQLPEHQR
jgi:pantetheine-phosphate adenylyltransferase